MHRRQLLISAAAGLLGWSLRPQRVLASPAAILELKLCWVKADGDGTTVQLVLNVCARSTRTHPLTGEEEEVLVRSTRRTFTRSFGVRRTPAQCMALLRQFLIEKAQEDGHEIYQ